MPVAPMARGQYSVSDPLSGAAAPGSPRAGRADWLPLIVVGGLYLVAVVALFLDRVREFADETDNLLGGLLITRGERLYVDFFSSHMPLAYYVAAVGALAGATSLDQFRLYTRGLLVLATLAIVWGFRGRLPLVVLGTWALLTVFAHALQWGDMLTASTCAGYGLFVAGLLFFTTPRLAFSLTEKVVLSGAVFVAVQGELVAIYPLILLGACYVVVRWRHPREILALAGIVAVPHLLLLAAMGLTGELGDFLYYAFQFNQTYYAQFVMNPSVLGILHDWEAQYRTYLLQSLQPPLGVHAALVLGNVAAALLVMRTRGVVVAAIYYAFIGLCHIRDEGGYYLASYFSLALLVGGALAAVQSRRGVAAYAFAGGVAVLLLGFGWGVVRAYDFSGRPARPPGELPVIAALTRPGEPILVVPYDPYLYLASDRRPASSIPYYFPWQALDPRAEGRIIDDLRATRPPLVIFHGNEAVNDQWLPREYGTRLYDFLLAEGYAPVDAAEPFLADFLVRPDRLAEGRARLLERK
jgi:hypothetical protein